MGLSFIGGALIYFRPTNLYEYPSWEAARSSVRAMPEDELLKFAEEWYDRDLFNVEGAPSEEVVERLLEVVTIIESGWNGMDRRFYYMPFPPLKADLLLTGERTSGNIPEGVRIFSLFEECGAAKAAGFLESVDPDEQGEAEDE